MRIPLRFLCLISKIWQLSRRGFEFASFDLPLPPPVTLSLARKDTPCFWRTCWPFKEAEGCANLAEARHLLWLRANPDAGRSEARSLPRAKGARAWRPLHRSPGPGTSAAQCGSHKEALLPAWLPPLTLLPGSVLTLTTSPDPREQSPESGQNGVYIFKIYE